MSTRLVIDGIAITYIGREEYALCAIPVPSKNEFGIDVLILKYVGALHKYDAFIRSLAQGQHYDQPGRRWYVQTWETDDNKLWPIVTVICKGFCSGKLPKPKSVDIQIVQNVTIEATGLSITVPAGEITEATKTINYRCLQTSWQYVTDSRPKGGKILRVSQAVEPQIINSVIQTNLGSYNGANAPAQLVTALTVLPSDFMLDIQADEVFGTPFFEVTEIVARMYVVP